LLICIPPSQVCVLSSTPDHASLPYAGDMHGGGSGGGGGGRGKNLRIALVSGGVAPPRHASSRAIQLSGDGGDVKRELLRESASLSAYVLLTSLHNVGTRTVTCYLRP
jgi:hypothetical protein